MDVPSDANPADAYTRMWTDMMSKMSTATMGQAFGASKDDAAKQMRQAFFDAWAKSCDEYMHSEQFLDMMKQSMDGAMAFREQMNQFLSNALADGPMPSRDDTDSILLAVRSLEDRVLDRLETLSQRVEALEQGGDGGSAKGKSGSRRTKGGSR